MEARPAGRRIARNLTFLSFAEACVRLLTLLTSVVAARVLGPSKLGEVALGLTLAVFFAGVADGGLTMLTYRRIVAEPQRLTKLVVDTTFVQVGLGVVLMAGLMIVAVVAPFGAGRRELLIVFAPYILTQSLNVLYALRALEQMVWVAFINAMTQIAVTAPTIALVLVTHDPVWVAAGLIFGQLLGDLMIYAVLVIGHGLRLALPDLSAVGPLLRGGRALLGSLLLFSYLAALEIPVLNLFRSSHEVGEYSAATRVIGTAAIISQVLLNAVLPELVRRFHQNRERFAYFATQLVALSTRLTLAGMAIFVVEPQAIIKLLYGHQYTESVVVLAILAPVVPFVWFGHLIGFVQVAAARQRDFFICLAIAAITATVAYPVVAAVGGRIGLAIGASSVYGLQAVAFAVFARRHLRLGVVRPALRQLPYALVPIAIIFAFRVVSSHGGLAIVLALWLAGMLAVEAAARWPTVAFLATLRRAS